jgi:Na+-transporting NADH:ubiquinone oxidoreductase subunit A
MLIKINAGLDLDPATIAHAPVEDAPAVDQVALVGPEYTDIRFKLAVTEGTRVRLGQTLMTHRKYPELRFTAPAAGLVKAVERGARRRLMSVIIDLEGEDEVEFPAFSAVALASLPLDEIRASLLQSGLWTAFRARPYNRVPLPGTRPRVIFVTAIDTSPGAADPAGIVDEQQDAFRDGLSVIDQLSADKTYLCTAPGSQVSGFATDGIITAEFQGRHPAGLPGTHMHYLEPVSERADLWHIGYQDVIAIGKLFRSGRLWTERFVAVYEPGQQQSRLLRTRAGASLTQLLKGAKTDTCRIISGDLLSGRHATANTAYLGRYDRLVSVLPEFSQSHRSKKPASNMTTDLHGAPSGMLSVEAFERIWPFATPAVPLLRALLINDTATAVRLGCLGMAEEDLALCSYVCPAKYDYGAALRSTLREIQKGA